MTQTDRVRLVMMWPLDPNANRNDALTEAQDRLDEIAGTHRLSGLRGTFAVIPPDHSIGSTRWHLLYDGTARQTDASPLTEYLPLEVVIRDGFGKEGGRQRRPERPAAVAAVRELLGKGELPSQIASRCGLSVRTIQRAEVTA